MPERPPSWQSWSQRSMLGSSRHPCDGLRVRKQIEILRIAATALLCILLVPTAVGARELTLGDAEVAAWMVPRIE